MPKPRKLQEVLDILQDKVEDIGEVEEVEDDVIQAPKEEPVAKVKKPRTEKQIQAFIKMKADAKVVNDVRKLVKEDEAKSRKEAKEEKIVKTAITIRRKQIKREAIIDVSDEDDTPMPPRKRVLQAKPPPKVPEFIFF